MARIRRAMAAAAAAWGAGLDDALLFVGRAARAAGIPATGAGIFILNPHQEVYAFLPATGRFRQLTTEDGRVSASCAARSAALVYVTADKLVRGASRTTFALRGVAIGELTLATMTPAPPIRNRGDVRRLEIASVAAEASRSASNGDRDSGAFCRGDRADARAVPAPIARRAARGGPDRAGRGRRPTDRRRSGAARSSPARSTRAGPRTVVVSGRGGTDLAR